MIFPSAVRKLGAGLMLVAACTTAAVAATYERYGVSGGDVADYDKATASLSACTAARSADRDPLHPSGNPRILMHVASLYGRCGEELRKRRSSDGAIRTNDLFLSLTCAALGPAGGGSSSVSACSARPAPVTSPE